VRERGLRNSRKETKEELFYIQVFSLLFNYLLSLLAIWSDFSVFEKKVQFAIVEGKLLITITIL
jgi:hypothetical protein